MRFYRQHFRRQSDDPVPFPRVRVEHCLEIVRQCVFSTQLAHFLRRPFCEHSQALVKCVFSHNAHPLQGGAELKPPQNDRPVPVFIHRSCFLLILRSVGFGQTRVRDRLPRLRHALRSRVHLRHGYLIIPATGLVQDPPTSLKHFHVHRITY